MTIAERNNKLKHYITCLKCETSGKQCDVNCATQYDAGNMGEIIENLEDISKALEQESCEHEISKEQATHLLKFYGMDEEHINAVIKALQTECEDAISRAKAIEGADKLILETGYDNEKVIEMLNELPPVNPKVKTGKWLHCNDDRNDWSECSECGYGDEGEVKFGEETPYCPHCGSKNESEDKEWTEKKQ